LENIIKKIVEIDENARQIENEAVKQNVDSMEEISVKRDEIRDRYLERARKRIEIIRKEEQKKADSLLVEINRKNREKSELMEKIYNDNRDNWISAIVKNVIGE
jgi:hypothetical protein